MSTLSDERMHQVARPPRSAPVRVGLSLVVTVTAVALNAWLRPAVGSPLFLTPLTAAVVVSAWLGGLLAGLAATVVSVIATAYFLAVPVGSFVIGSPDDRLRLAVFVATAVLLTFVVESRNKAARRYAEQREWWRVALRSIGDGVIVCHPDGRVAFMNTVSETLTGWSDADAAGLPLSEVFRIVNEDSRAVVEDPVAKVLREGKVVGLANHTLLLRRDGSEVSIDDSAAPVRDELGRLLGVILVYRDVSERRWGERALTEQADRLQMQAELLDHAYDAVFVRDEAPQVLYWNPAAAELYGWTEQEAVGQNPHHLLRTRFPISLETVEEALATSGHWAGELVHVTRDGREVIVDSRHVMVPADGEHPCRILEINRDITVRKRAEEGLRRNEERLAALYKEAQEANRLKDEFLATLSHELRTPLNAIRGWTQLLLGGRLGPDIVRRAYETIDRNAQAQTQLITDILDVSRIITGKLRLERETVDLAELLNDTLDGVRPAAEAKRLQLNYSANFDTPRMMADRARLQQVFWNLLSNAVKFTRPGGRVDVRVAQLDSRIEVTVSDTGVGIRRDFLPHVFERFTQSDASASRAYGGLGLGLAISRHLVELHGGTIAAFSEGEERGATFVVSLPIQAVVDDEKRERVKPPDASPEPAAAPSLEGVKVLVVDDEADARELLSAALSQQGAEVSVAASTAEALMLMQQERPALVVSDIGMPGEDGYTFMRIVRALPRAQGGDTPAIALTAYARPEDRLRALAAGYQEHVAKPVTPAELAAVVAAALARHAARGEGE